MIGINAFNQPDVEASKVATRIITGEYEQTGKLPEETPFFEDDGITLFADAKNSAALVQASTDKSLVGYLKAHMDRLDAEDYFAVLGRVSVGLEIRQRDRSSSLE